MSRRAKGWYDDMEGRSPVWHSSTTPDRVTRTPSSRSKNPPSPAKRFFWQRSPRKGGKSHRKSASTPVSQHDGRLNRFFRSTNNRNLQGIRGHHSHCQDRFALPSRRPKHYHHKRPYNHRSESVSSSCSSSLSYQGSSSEHSGYWSGDADENSHCNFEATNQSVCRCPQGQCSCLTARGVSLPPSPHREEHPTFKFLSMPFWSSSKKHARTASRASPVTRSTQFTAPAVYGVGGMSLGPVAHIYNTHSPGQLQPMYMPAPPPAACVPPNYQQPPLICPNPHEHNHHADADDNLDGDLEDLESFQEQLTNMINNKRRSLAANVAAKNTRGRSTHRGRDRARASRSRGRRHASSNGRYTAGRGEDDRFHACTDCGTLRSASFHDVHGRTERRNFCAKCRARRLRELKKNPEKVVEEFCLRCGQVLTESCLQGKKSGRGKVSASFCEGCAVREKGNAGDTKSIHLTGARGSLRGPPTRRSVSHVRTSTRNPEPPLAADASASGSDSEDDDDDETSDATEDYHHSTRRQVAKRRCKAKAGGASKSRSKSKKRLPAKEKRLGSPLRVRRALSRKLKKESGSRSGWSTTSSRDTDDSESSSDNDSPRKAAKKGSGQKRTATFASRSHGQRRVESDSDESDSDDSSSDNSEYVRKSKKKTAAKPKVKKAAKDSSESESEPASSNIRGRGPREVGEQENGWRAEPDLYGYYQPRNSNHQPQRQPYQSQHMPAPMQGGRAETTNSSGAGWGNTGQPERAMTPMEALQASTRNISNRTYSTARFAPIHHDAPSRNGPSAANESHLYGLGLRFNSGAGPQNAPGGMARNGGFGGFDARQGGDYMPDNFPYQSTQAEGDPSQPMFDPQMGFSSGTQSRPSFQSCFSQPHKPHGGMPEYSTTWGEHEPSMPGPNSSFGRANTQQGRPGFQSGWNDKYDFSNYEPHDDFDPGFQGSSWQQQQTQGNVDNGNFAPDSGDWDYYDYVAGGMGNATGSRNQTSFDQNPGQRSSST